MHISILLQKIDRLSSFQWLDTKHDGRCFQSEIKQCVQKQIPSEAQLRHTGNIDLFSSYDSGIRDKRLKREWNFCFVPRVEEDTISWWFSRTEWGVVNNQHKTRGSRRATEQSLFIPLLSFKCSYRTCTQFGAERVAVHVIWSLVSGKTSRKHFMFTAEFNGGRNVWSHDLGEKRSRNPVLQNYRFYNPLIKSKKFCCWNEFYTYLVRVRVCFLLICCNLFEKDILFLKPTTGSRCQRNGLSEKDFVTVPGMHIFELLYVSLPRELELISRTCLDIILDRAGLMFQLNIDILQPRNK